MVDVRSKPCRPWLEIVGVAGHMGLHALTRSQDDGVYWPLAAGDVNPVRLAIWVREDSALLAPRVPELARAVDPHAVIAMPIPLDEMFEGDWYLLRAFVLGAALLVGVLLGLPFAGALCYEFLELTGFGRSVPGAMPMASALGVSVMLIVSLAACTLPTLRALRIAPVDALRGEG
jgi:hypothetical protein